jgi:hypothetical protein
MSEVVYNLEGKEVSIFGDIEGGWPFDELLKNSNFYHIPFKKIEKNIEVTLPYNRCMVFTGDLIDNYGPYDIQWLEAMVKAKEQYSDRVLLGIGNRDLNKIRMLDECFIFKYDDNGNVFFPWENFDGDFDKLCEEIVDKFNKTYKFLFEETDIKKKYDKTKYMNIVNIGRLHWSRDKNKNDMSDGSPNEWPNSIDRISNIYKNGLAAASVLNNRWEELFNLNLMFFKNDIPKNSTEYNEDRYNKNEKIKYVAIALTNMMMGAIWPDYIINKCSQNIKTLFTRINGLYIKYLQSANLIGKFTWNNKRFVFSHSGIPPYLSAPLGYAPKKKDGTSNNETSLDDILSLIEQEKKKFLNVYDISKFENLDVKKIEAHIKKISYNEEDENDLKLYKFIQLTAATGIKSLDDYLVGSLFSPVNTHDGNNLSAHPMFNKSSKYEEYLGGYGADKNTIKYYKFNTNDIDYNIFGHQPQGLFPIALEQEKTTHICLDVSSVPKDPTGVGTYAFLHLINTNQILIKGSIKFPKTYEFDNKTDLDLNEAFNYSIDINEFKIKIEDYIEFYKEYDNIRHLNMNKFHVLGYNNNKYIIKYVLENTFKSKCTIEKIYTAGKGKSCKSLKKTDKKFSIDGKTVRNVYVGSRGGEYVKIKGDFVPVKSLKKARK